MSGMLPAADIFTRINDGSEKLRLFSDLVKARGEILAKLSEPSQEVFVLLAHDESGKKINCKLAGISHHTPPTSGHLILTFFVGGEKYFFQSDYKISGEYVSISIESQLYHLQRREDYRIHIPTGFQAFFEMVSLNGKTQKRAIPLMDLSGGGCRVQVDAKILPLKSHDELKGHLFMSDRDPITVVGSVRHMKAENHGKGPLTCGIQFVGLTEPLKNRIIAAVMDLYRMHFIGRQG